MTRSPAALATNCGTFAITLDVRGAPRTSASLVSLARSGCDDGTILLRIVERIGKLGDSLEQPTEPVVVSKVVVSVGR